MFGLLGPNGAGKSTLMRTIATLQGVDAGSLYFDDLDVLHQKHEVRNLFETITVFDNEVAAATYTERPDGTFLVRIEVEAHKLRADGDGVESEIPIDDWIDIAVFGEGEAGGEGGDIVLFLEKRRIRASQVAFKIAVDRRPVRVGIDPYQKLIDRDSGDNVRAVSRLP